MTSARTTAVPETPSPTDLRKRSWLRTVKQTGQAVQHKQLTDRAAALTYYAVLALFPAIIVLVSLIGLVGDPQKTTDKILELAGQFGSVPDQLEKTVNNLAAQQNTASVLFVVGILTALWSASGYIGAFIRAMNVIYEVEEGRGFLRLRPLQLLLTVVGLVVAAVVGVSLVVSGSIARNVGNTFGLGDTAVTVWDIAKWPVMLLLVVLLLALLYWAGPNVRQPRWRWLTAGSLIAVLLWILASLGFAAYVSGFSSYNKTYGALAGVVVFLIWLWLTNLAILFGGAFDAELERERQLAAGLDAADDLKLPPRDDPDN